MASLSSETNIIKTQISGLVKKDQRKILRDIAVEALKLGLHPPRAIATYDTIRAIETKMGSMQDQNEIARLNRERSGYYVEYGHAIVASPEAANTPGRLAELLAKNTAVEDQIKALGEQLLASTEYDYQPQGVAGDQIPQGRRYMRLVMYIFGLIVIAVILYLLLPTFTQSDS